MRYLCVLLFTAATLAAVGCDQASQASAPPATPATSPAATPAPPTVQPIVSGEFVDGILWSWPVTSFWKIDPDENVGTVPPKGSRVEVYEDFILVTTPDGVTELSLHGWYTNLQFKRDPSSPP